MSMPIAKIYCDRCEFVIGTNVGWGRFSYTLSEGRHLSIDRGLGWCNDCESLTPIESFAKPTRLNEELEQLDSRIALLQPKGIFSKLLWNQSQSKINETLKHNGEYPIIGVNTFLSSKGSPTIIPSEVIRATTEEKEYQISMLKELEKTNAENKNSMLKDLQVAAVQNKNLFDKLMEVTKYCSLGQITNTLFGVGGQYRRNM